MQSSSPSHSQYTRYLLFGTSVFASVSSNQIPPHRRITQDDAPSMSMALPPVQAGQTENGMDYLTTRFLPFLIFSVLLCSSPYTPPRHTSILLSIYHPGPPFTQPPQPQTHLPGAGAHSKPGTSTASGSSSGTGVGAMYVGHGHGHVQGQGGSQRKKARLG